MQDVAGNGMIDNLPVCAIGASAVGIAPLREFFRRVPDDLGMADVVITHMAPDHPRALSEILASCTSMPVRQVDDAPELKPNTVYVLPPDRELVIDGNDITARPFTLPSGERAQIDLFFRSIAEARGDGCAIVLSGSGSDGAQGVLAVRAAGGIVFVQEPKDAEYAMMPRSAIASGAADSVAPVARLVERLVEVVRHKTAMRTMDRANAEEGLQRIITFPHSRTGHDSSKYMRATLMRRVGRRMQVVRRGSFRSYLDYMTDNPEEAQELFEDLLISVTSFFRDPAAYDALTEIVVPSLFDEADEAGIHIWVAGCATGEEAYRSQS